MTTYLYTLHKKGTAVNNERYVIFMDIMDKLIKAVMIVMTVVRYLAHKRRNTTRKVKIHPDAPTSDTSNAD